MENLCIEILHSGEFSDQTLRVISYTKNGEKLIKDLSVHKIILVAGSPVFERMIYGSMSTGDVIEVQEESFEMFYKFLEGMYSRGKLIDFSTMCSDDIKCLIKIAHRYLVKDIVDLCGMQLEPKKINLDAIEAFNIACLFDIVELKTKCIEWFRKNSKELFAHEDFIFFTADALSLILQENDLAVDSELEIFKGVIRWCESLGSDSGFSSTANIFNSTFNDDNAMPMIKKENEFMDSGLLTSTLKDVSMKTNNIYEDITLNNNVTLEPNKMEVVKDVEFSLDYGKNIRHLLMESGVLKNIRFFTFSPVDFVTHVVRKNILNKYEISTILLVTNLQKLSNGERREEAIKSTIESNMQHLQDISLKTTPRNYDQEYLQIRKEGVFMLDFKYCGWLTTPADECFPEKFICCSKIPIIITSVILPSKDKANERLQGLRYEEIVEIDIFKAGTCGMLRNELANCTYNNRRFYRENFEFPIHYDLFNVSPVLVDGQVFFVYLKFAKGGSYYGGYRYCKSSHENNLICVPRDKSRGIIQGFRFKYVI